VDRDDEQVRALFAEVGAQQGPPLGISADGIARRGRRIKVARLGAGVAAGLTVVAVITFSVILAANRPTEPATPPPATVTTTDTVDTTAVPTTTTTSPTATTTD
jgi:hypothetical protein